MLRVILFFVLILPAICQGQNSLTKSKVQVRKQLKTYLKKNDSLSAKINETDSTIILSIKQGASLPAEFIYYFNEKGKCNTEKVVSYCDSCHTKYLNRVLTNEKYGWKKINENQYISDFKHKITLELPADENQQYFVLIYSDWSKELYNLLTER